MMELNATNFSGMPFGRLVFFITFFMIGGSGLHAQNATYIHVGGSSQTKIITRNVADFVDSGITVSANGLIDGFTVSITGTYTTGDVLDYSGTLPLGVSAQPFNTGNASLVFTGAASAANWQNLLRTVTLRTTSVTCSPGGRKVSFVAGNKYYNIMNGHFYEYNATGMSWTDARAYAAGLSYFGRKGYLASIASADENSFYNMLIGQNSWIGCTDNYQQINAALGYTLYSSQATADGNFYWVSGPEKGLKICAQNAWGAGGHLPLAGVYNNWQSGEPNDFPGQTSSSPGEEDYGHVYAGSGLWNDFPNAMSVGCVVEFGDMPGDNTSAGPVFTREIYISGSVTGSIGGGNVKVCQGSNSTTLTLNGLSGSVIRWEYSWDNFLSTNIAIGNTTTTLTLNNLSSTTYYRAVVNTNSGCSNLETSAVPVYVLTAYPGNVTAAQDSVCTGADAVLTLNGNQAAITGWQTSPFSDFSSSVTDINQTNAEITYSISSSGTRYFRALVQQSACGTQEYSPVYAIHGKTGTAPLGGLVSDAEHCSAGNAGTLVLSGSSGSVSLWQYSTDEGQVWTDVANTDTSLSYLNLSVNTLYRARLQSAGCGSAYSLPGTVMIFGTTATRWDGGSSDDWGLASNWCGAVADNGLDVHIDLNAANHLLLDQSRSIGQVLFKGAGKHLDLGNFDLQAVGFSGYDEQNYIRTGGSGVLSAPVGDDGTVLFPVGRGSYNPLTLTNRTGSSDRFSVRVSDTVYQTGYSGDTLTEAHLRHTWDIGKSYPNGGNGLDFIFHYNSGAAAHLTDPALFHFEGGNWTEQTGSTASDSSRLVYTSYTGTFSPFYIGESLSPLSVRVYDFSARLQPREKSVLLQWHCTEPDQIQSFAVLRSPDGKAWERIGLLDAGQERSADNRYGFSDNAAFEGAYYRIRTEDKEGNVQFSAVLQVRTDEANAAVKVYPNPSGGTVCLYSLNPVHYTVLDLQQKTIAEGESEGQQALSLPPGIYLVKMQGEIGTDWIKLIVE